MSPEPSTEETMRKSRRNGTSGLRTLAAGGTIVIMLECAGLAPVRAQTLPSDAQPLCTVPASTFATWFASGKPSVSGVVNPANSVGFSPSGNCDFYTWAKQMFLWLTSPAPSVYGGNGLIMDSPVFYDVSPPDSNGNRTLLPH